MESSGGRCFSSCLAPCSAFSFPASAISLPAVRSTLLDTCGNLITQVRGIRSCVHESHTPDTDGVGISVLIVTSFYPAVYYAFFCESHWVAFYLTMTTVLGHTSPPLLSITACVLYRTGNGCRLISQLHAAAEISIAASRHVLGIGSVWRYSLVSSTLHQFP